MSLISVHPKADCSSREMDLAFAAWKDPANNKTGMQTAIHRRHLLVLSGCLVACMDGDSFGAGQFGFH